MLPIPSMLKRLQVHASPRAAIYEAVRTLLGLRFALPSHRSRVPTFGAVKTVGTISEHVFAALRVMWKCS